MLSIHRDGAVNEIDSSNDGSATRGCLIDERHNWCISFQLAMWRQSANKFSDGRTDFTEVFLPRLFPSI